MKPHDPQTPMIFLIVWTVCGLGQAILMIFFPSVARKMYLEWKSAFGIIVSPDSPMLGNDMIRLQGLIVAAIVIFGLKHMLSA
ncbi:MAG: hypothetical protein U0795_14625 [Pirellulales bacterium]